MFIAPFPGSVVLHLGVSNSSINDSADMSVDANENGGAALREFFHILLTSAAKPGELYVYVNAKANNRTKTYTTIPLSPSGTGEKKEK